MVKITKEAALEYHEAGRPGKIEVKPTKPYHTQTDLSLAYSPGVAFPCLEIQQTPDEVYKYTDKGNLVAVISNGTAVLGLGDIGAMSGKPVMEGKGLLFKIYGGVDVFDIEIDEKDPEKFCETVEKIAPTFGGINLEDIKAPQCFYIEERLKKTLDIPVMHDDQHGTAIISAAGLKNALEVAGKNIADVKIVVNGAGAAAISCTKLYVALELGILFLDIDHFKQLNDRYGHGKGDEGICAVAEVLKKHFDGDYVARYGGDEFLVVMAGRDPEYARQHAELLCTGVRECRIPNKIRCKSAKKFAGSILFIIHFNKVPLIIFYNYFSM